MDPTLEDEVGTECTKYGSVAGVVIFEARPRTGHPVHPQVLKKACAWARQTRERILLTTSRH